MFFLADLKNHYYIRDAVMLLAVRRCPMSNGAFNLCAFSTFRDFLCLVGVSEGRQPEIMPVLRDIPRGGLLTCPTAG